MPELPEVEHLRRTLLPALLGARIESLELRRADILRDGSARTVASFAGQTVEAVERHGKQLLLVTSGPALIVQLGMSGSLYLPAPSERAHERARPHVHALLRVVPRSADAAGIPQPSAPRTPARRSANPDPAGALELLFHDPRRFGALRAFDSRRSAVQARWASLGPDALSLDAGALSARLHGRRGGLKALLLDQEVVAGLGNIYVDELLHALKLHPCRPVSSLRQADLQRLTESIPRLLQAAIDVGGSTIRDYRDATGAPGEFVSRHQAYGRAGLPCLRCGTRLRAIVAGGRTTVFCPACQRPVRASRRS